MFKLFLFTEITKTPGYREFPCVLIGEGQTKKSTSRTAEQQRHPYSSTFLNDLKKQEKEYNIYWQHQDAQVIKARAYSDELQDLRRLCLSNKTLDGTWTLQNLFLLPIGFVGLWADDCYSVYIGNSFKIQAQHSEELKIKNK